MVMIILKTIGGNTETFKAPLRLIIQSDREAPSDGLEAEFIVSGSIPQLLSVRVLKDEYELFSGEIDEQREITRSGITRLIIRARSIESILLDNEAMPQTYQLPSFGLIFERHFRQLGFSDYIADDKSYNGELVISKGMSEWNVLSDFCTQFSGTKPFITSDGIIDISGQNVPDEIFISRSCMLSKTKKYSRCSLISDIMTRTYPAGSYNMDVKSNKAKGLSVKRKRYLNIVGIKNTGVLSVRDMIKKRDNAYESIELLCSGTIVCRPGDIIKSEGEDSLFSAVGVQYSFIKGIETTRITAEVYQDVDQQKYEK